VIDVTDTPGWYVNTQINWVADRKREPADTRPDLADYTTVDLVVRTEGQRKDWDVAFIVRNLFDEDAREPSAFGAPFVSIPNDLPLPGRAFYLQGSYKF
jgi:iron complex outermembrane receptor protein